MKRLNKIAKEDYTFNGLSKEVQEKLINDKIEFFQAIYDKKFQKIVSEEIHKMFPYSGVKYVYSFTNGINDGFGLKGEIYAGDAIELCNMSYTELEIELLEEFLYNDYKNSDYIGIKNYDKTSFTDDMIDMSATYNIVKVKRMYERWKEDPEVDKNLDVVVLCKKNQELEKELRIKLKTFCKEMKNKGYEILYNECKKEAEKQLQNSTMLYDENGEEI